MSWFLEKVISPRQHWSTNIIIAILCTPPGGEVTSLVANGGTACGWTAECTRQSSVHWHSAVWRYHSLKALGSSRQLRYFRLWEHSGTVCQLLTTTHAVWASTNTRTILSETLVYSVPFVPLLYRYWCSPTAVQPVDCWFPVNSYPGQLVQKNQLLPKAPNPWVRDDMGTSWLWYEMARYELTWIRLDQHPDSWSNGASGLEGRERASLHSALPAVPLSATDRGQVVHTWVSVTRQYNLKGSDTQQLAR